MKWEDVGGLEDVKKSILDTVQVGFVCIYTFYLLSISKIPAIWKLEGFVNSILLRCFF